MDPLYNQTNKLIQQTLQIFQTLQARPPNSFEIEQQISENISKINSNCEKLDFQVFKLPIDQRQQGKMRSDQLKYDAKHLQAGLDAAIQRRIRQETAANEREQLLNRRYTANTDTVEINMDFSIQHQNSLLSANQGVDQMLHTGANTLESLRNQRSVLKGTHKRIIDIANTLGLSNHTMRLIEKRVSEDKVIFVAGVVITLIVIILVIFYLT